MATQLGLYNAALIELGEGTIASLSEDRKGRRVLDSIYSSVLAECLEAGAWNFAMRTVKLDADTSITPAFGFTEVFAKPTDWVRTISLSADENFSQPLFRYWDDVNYLSADQTPLYLRYVSNSASWGLNLTLWPQSFTRYVEVALAERGCVSITQSNADKERLMRIDLPMAKRRAVARDAMNEATKFLPQGSWNTARGGSRGRDRGSRGSLIG
jgi:hypothetical protein